MDGDPSGLIRGDRSSRVRQPAPSTSRTAEEKPGSRHRQQHRPRPGAARAATWTPATTSRMASRPRPRPCRARPRFRSSTAGACATRRRSRRRAHEGDPSRGHRHRRRAREGVRYHARATVGRTESRAATGLSWHPPSGQNRMNATPRARARDPQTREAGAADRGQWPPCYRFSRGVGREPRTVSNYRRARRGRSTPSRSSRRRTPRRTSKGRPRGRRTRRGARGRPLPVRRGQRPRSAKGRGVERHRRREVERGAPLPIVTTSPPVASLPLSYRHASVRQTSTAPRDPPHRPGCYATVPQPSRRRASPCVKVCCSCAYSALQNAHDR